jgi:hypothetical protein
MTISILLPTRGRPALCSESARSLMSTARRPREIEFVLRRDFDDPSLYDLRASVVVFNVFGDPRGYAGLGDYYNECARAATGEWLLIWNDDCVMRTQHWDDALCDRAGLVAFEHGHFPAVSRRWLDAAGRITASPHADTYIAHVCELLIGQGLMDRQDVNASAWDIHHRADELDDEGSARRRREVLGPEGTSAQFFKPEMRAAIEADAGRLADALRARA